MAQSTSSMPAAEAPPDNSLPHIKAKTRNIEPFVNRSLSLRVFPGLLLEHPADDAADAVEIGLTQGRTTGKAEPSFKNLL